MDNIYPHIFLFISGFKSFRIGVIQSNPEKSKHLETATVQLGKFSVDFVNLRTGVYPGCTVILIVD